MLGSQRGDAFKLCNGGKFHLSRATLKTFPGSPFQIERNINNVIRLLESDVGESIIIEEERSKKDEELRRRHGERVALDTDNRLLLCTVLESFEPPARN